jgi:hypothetical protein
MPCAGPWSSLPLHWLRGGKAAAVLLLVLVLVLVLPLHPMPLHMP